MREGIGVYKAKRIDNDEWVEGSLLYDTEQNEAYIAESFEDRAAYLQQVNPETIGRWTGLDDKNGVKVFEGDIVESIFTKKAYTVCYGSYTYINEYEEEEYAWGWYNTDEDGFVTAFALPAEWAIVIGSIHDKVVEE